MQTLLPEDPPTEQQRGREAGPLPRTSAALHSREASLDAGEACGRDARGHLRAGGAGVARVKCGWERGRAACEPGKGEAAS